MIEPGTVLFPEKMDCSQLYYGDSPYAYWSEDIGEWVLYEEYNDYTSICHPNDCICAKSKEDIFREFREEDVFRNFRNSEELCRNFKQRSLKEDNNMTPEEEKKIIADTEELLRNCRELDEELKYIGKGIDFLTNEWKTNKRYFRDIPGRVTTEDLIKTVFHFAWRSRGDFNRVKELKNNDLC